MHISGKEYRVSTNHWTTTLPFESIKSRLNSKKNLSL